MIYNNSILTFFLFFQSFLVDSIPLSSMLTLSDESVSISLYVELKSDTSEVITGTLMNTSSERIAFQSSTILGGFYIVDSVCYINYGVMMPSLIQPRLPLSAVISLPVIEADDSVKLPLIHLPKKSSYHTLRIGVDYLPYFRKEFKRRGRSDTINIISDDYIVHHSIIEVLTYLPSH